jgi:hypothetical protein
MPTATPTAPIPTTSPVQIHAKSTPRAKLTPMRRIALIAGLLYLLTFLASIPQLKLFSGIVDDPAGFISGRGSNNGVLFGSLLEIVTAAAGIGTAITLYPVTRRVSRAAAVGFVTSRVVEAALILVGVLSLLSVVTLKAHFAGATGAEADSLRVTGEALVSIRQWSFLVGPGLIAGVNGLFLGYVMYRGRLVPRIIPTIGLIGAPLIIISAIATILGGWAQTSGTGAAFGLLIAAWEFSLGIYLTFKGFKSTSIVIEKA